MTLFTFFYSPPYFASTFYSPPFNASTQASDASRKSLIHGKGCH